MKKPSDSTKEQREKLIGLGERSFRKSYYPELQRRLNELERFRALLDSSNDVFFVLSAQDSRIIDLNSSACNRLGYAREELLGQQFFALTDLSEIPFDDENTESAGNSGPIDARLYDKEGSDFVMEVSFNKQSFSDADYIIVVARDVSDKRQAETTLVALAQAVSARTGEDFLRTLTKQLTKVLRADFALIGELIPGTQRTVQTIAVYGDDNFLDNFEYQLSGTPCNEVVNSGTCSFPDHVAASFPDDTLLSTMHIQGYVGAPLIDTAGRTLGVLVVLYQRPINRPLIAENLLSIFASRAAAELERRHAQTALIDSENRFRTVFETTTDAIAIARLDGTIIDINPGFIKQSGFSRAETIGKNSAELGLWSDLKLREKMRSVLMENGIIHNMLADFQLKDGLVKTGLLSAQMVELDDQPCMLVITRDISDIVATQRALRNSERQLRALVGNIPGAVYRCTFGDNWAMEFISDVIEELSGYPANDFIDNNVREFTSIVYPEDREMVASVVNEAVAARVPYSIDYRIIHRNGSIRWLYEKGQAVYGDDGEVLCLDGVLFDLTERKQAEETMQRFDQIKSEFISTAAHELRTPLTSVMGFSEFLLEPEEYGPFTKEQTDDFTREIYRKAETLERIIDEMLDISRIESGQRFSLQLEERDPNPILTGVASEFARNAPNHTLALDLEECCERHCALDENRLIQVLENLLSNAIKYSPQGGKINISTRFEHDRCVIEIKDHGIGMTAEQIDRIFEKFYRVDSSNTAIGGLGLGMSIAQQIVLAHDGEINVTSSPGDGTAVRLWLPLIE